jgi:hypothetical protein
MRPEEFHANAQQHAVASGPPAAPGMAGWDTFPFEPNRLRVVALRDPVIPEIERTGEGGLGCPACAEDRAAIWSDQHWRLSVAEPSGAPLVLMLEPRLHHDLADLPDERAVELGLLTVRIAQAMESLANIARAHVARWGDARAHLHIFFFARPAGFPQLHGRFFAVWEGFLPDVPPDHGKEDAARVAETLVRTYGGTSSKLSGPEAVRMRRSMSRGRAASAATGAVGLGRIPGQLQAREMPGLRAPDPPPAARCGVESIMAPVIADLMAPRAGAGPMPAESSGQANARPDTALGVSEFAGHCFHLSKESLPVSTPTERAIQIMGGRLFRP